MAAEELTARGGAPRATSLALGEVERRDRRFRALIKRGLDLSITLALLIILLPVLGGIALLVLMSSPGPILFRQQRVGRDGRVFNFYKFRTMVHGNDHSAHREYYRCLVAGEVDRSAGAFKMKNDPRVTRVGRILRRASLDELPQLINIVKGDMSLVGPRPAIPYEVEMYGSRELMRLRVKPGLTGLWQVSGRGTLSFDKMINLDLEYIASDSLALDLLILLRTPWVVLTGKGAY
jgi:lipopolysaccharide/colanic/teichoic acid biosynthesis glycosyltransferase